jgi:SSS family solute:Na+ symporter
VVAAYFSAGGLRTTAWLHVIQITVKMTGFFIAVPWALHAIGGWEKLHVIDAPPAYFSPLGGGLRGVLGYLVVFVAPFFISPGLLQRLYGARDESAVRRGVGWQAVMLLLYAVLPVLMGMIARAAFPALANPELALPTVLRELLPWWLGALLLAAVFSAELSAADAVLFMLSTSLGQDLYKSVLNPDAREEQLLRVTRWASVAGGVFGTALAIVLPTVADALIFFYGLLTVVLMVPLLAGLYLKSPTSFAALMKMSVSVTVMLAAQFLTAGAGVGILNPVALGVGAAAATMGIIMAWKGLFSGRHIPS